MNRNLRHCVCCSSLREKHSLIVMLVNKAHYDCLRLKHRQTDRDKAYRQLTLADWILPDLLTCFAFFSCLKVKTSQKFNLSCSICRCRARPPAEVASHQQLISPAHTGLLKCLLKCRSTNLCSCEEVSASLCRISPSYQLLTSWFRLQYLLASQEYIQFEFIVGYLAWAFEGFWWPLSTIKHEQPTVALF